MSYWEDEAVERMLAIEEGAVSTTEEMIELYEQALDDIDDEIRKIRYNFQKRFGLDEETANYFLDTEQQKHNLENTVKAMESAPDDAARMNLLEYLRRDGLSIRAYSAREERFNSLKQVIHLRVKALSTDATRLLTDALKEVYKESYYTLIDNAAKRINAGMNFTVLADDAIEQAITAKWKGARFSERIWKRTDELSARAQKIVVKGMISGASEQKLSKELAAAFDVSEFQAATLVRTETNHAHAIADLQAYNDLGVEKYLYIASLDERTCEICQSLDGEIFNVSEAREGENYPTMHPRCRCVTSINLDLTSRAARNPITGKTYETDGFVSYKQWKESMTDEERSALDLAVKKNKNKSADSAQYEQYKSVLGTKNVGRSLDKFQELKYTDSEKWTELKGAFRYAGQNPGADMNAYRCMRELQGLGVKGSIHIPSRNIDVSTLSFDSTHINTQRHHGVTEKQAKSYIEKASMSLTVWGGQFERYYSKQGAAYIDIDKSEIRTSYKTHEFNEDVKAIMEVLKKYGK